MVVITEALNQKWEADWNNPNQPKWRSWFNMCPSRFGFHFAHYVHSTALAGGGSRLSYETRELARYSAEKFADIWKKIQLG